AQQAGEAFLSAHAPTRQRRPTRSPPLGRRLLLGGLLAVLLVAGGLGTYAVLRQRPSQAVPEPPIPSVLTLDLGQQGLTCPSNSLWSPDGRQIAMRLHTTSCSPGAANPVDALLAVFDARTGKLVQKLSPQQELDRRLTGASWGSFTWSPDGSRLMVAV